MTTRREFLRGVAAAAVGASVPFLDRAAIAKAGGAAGRKPNIVFLLIDQLRADVLGLYGGGKTIETPHIDSLGAKSLTFDQAYSTCPVCEPYRGMLITGRTPTRTGIVINRVEVSAEQNPDAIGSVFSRAGYDTGYIGKWHLSAGARRADGKFERDNDAIRAYKATHPDPEFVPPGPSRLGFQHWEAYNYHEDFNDYWFYRDEPEKIRADGFETDIQIEQATAFMRARRGQERPFFLMISPHPPHPPLTPEAAPPGYLDRVARQVRLSPNQPAELDANGLLKMRCYYAMAKNTDDNVGRLVAAIDALGLADDTILVFTADHGAMNGSHGFTNKMVPYTEAMKVPLVMRWPGQIAAGRTDALQTPLDHLTTLAALAGVAAPPGADGIDLSPVALGRSSGSREEVLTMNFVSHWTYFQSGTRVPEWRGLRTPRFTYTRYLDGREQLFDDLADPYQLRNLANGDGEMERLKQFRRRLDEMLASVDDAFLPGTEYAKWYDGERNLVATALGPVR